MSASHLSFAPIWVPAIARASEMEYNWKGAYEEVAERLLPRGANILSCHVVYKVKEGGRRRLNIKERNVKYGHRDRDFFSIRRDSASADFSIVRLVVSLSVMLALPLGTAEVERA